MPILPSAIWIKVKVFFGQVSSLKFAKLNYFQNSNLNK